MPGRHGFPGDWPPSAPGDPGWAGDTPWGGGNPFGWLPPDGIDALDPRFPIRHAQPAALFWHLVKHAPVTAPWRQHLGFTVDETARAVAAENTQAETFVVPLDVTAPIPVVRVPRVYPELSEDTLAHEFTEADAARLAYALDHDGSV